MATKKYVSLSKLSSFLDKLKTTFASLTHTHSYDDLRNKPFYEGSDYSSILTNGTSTVNFYEWGGGVYGAAITDAPQVLKQDVSHKVIWDGVEYTMTCSYGGNNESGNPITCLGAPYGDYLTYPFGIDTYKTVSGTYEFSIHTNSTASTHTVDILEYGSKFVTLDDRFISDNIARTVDVDTAIGNINTTISGKADTNHTHTIGNVTNLQATLDGKVPTSRTINGKALSSNIALSASDVGAAKSDHTHSTYATKASPVFTGSISMQRDTDGTTGNLSTALGYYNEASGSYSFAVGSDNVASGYASVAIGASNTSSADGTFAGGISCTASADESFAFGKSLEAASDYQFVTGKNNVVDAEGKYVHIVGNGLGNGTYAKRNAHTLDWDGNAWFRGNVYVGGTSQNSGATMLASVSAVTTAEYTALEEAEATNANTLYVLTDAEEEVIPQIQIVTWESDD